MKKEHIVYGYLLVSGSLFCLLSFHESTTLLHAKQQGQLQNLPFYRQAGLGSMDELDLAIYGAYRNFPGVLVISVAWPLILLWLFVPYLAILVVGK